LTLWLFPAATANTSSVFTNAIKNLSSKRMDLSNFCDNEVDISAYLRFIIIWHNASSARDPPAVIIGTVASCPADVTLVIDINSVSKTPRPLSVANMPNANATDRYPKQIGVPSIIPFIKLLFLFIYSVHLLIVFLTITFKKSTYLPEGIVFVKVLLFGSATMMPVIINPNHTRIRFPQPIRETAFAKIVLDVAAAI